jgi:hypothetical protein
MKILLVLLTLFSLSFSNQNVFMLDEHDKELELEAKIISKISNEILKKRAKLYIPDISKTEKKIYSNYFELTKSCKNADFVFDKYGLKNNDCGSDKKVYFTNNYKKLISNRNYIGAFFWNKSRPNIVFAKQRLDKDGILLSYKYEKYIEDIDD